MYSLVSYPITIGAQCCYGRGGNGHRYIIEQNTKKMRGTFGDHAVTIIYTHYIYSSRSCTRKRSDIWRVSQTYHCYERVRALNFQSLVTSVTVINKYGKAFPTVKMMFSGPRL